MLINTILSAALAVVATATPVDQQPILREDGDFSDSRHLDVITELEKAGLIPSILDPFTPLLTLNATWKKASAELGNTIKPKKAKHQPLVQFIDTVPSLSATSDSKVYDNEQNPVPLNTDIQLTIALTDPDAPSRSNPEWSQICHWIATDVQLTDPGEGPQGFLTSDAFSSSSSLTEIMPYKAPGPPPKTGAHRYLFVALAPLNGTTERLHLSTPRDRQRWGYEGQRAGLREWARENGLIVVGANFVYAKHKKQ